MNKCVTRNGQGKRTAYVCLDCRSFGMNTHTPDARGGSGCGASASTTVSQHRTIRCVYELNMSCGRSLGIPRAGTVTPSHQRAPLMGRSSLLIILSPGGYSGILLRICGAKDVSFSLWPPVILKVQTSSKHRPSIVQASIFDAATRKYRTRTTYVRIHPRESSAAAPRHSLASSAHATTYSCNFDV
jgi:hypothetical protein